MSFCRAKFGSVRHLRRQRCAAGVIPLPAVSFWSSHPPSATFLKSFLQCEPVVCCSQVSMGVDASLYLHRDSSIDFDDFAKE